YYVACAADKIVANPGTITGSIGVIVESVNVEELFRKIGLESVVVKSGRHKDLGSPTRKMTEEEKKLLQEVLDNVHEQFIRAVAAGRNLPVDKVRPIADGRIFSGEQAITMGLVDSLGNLEDAIAMAAKMTGIKGEPEVIYPEKKRFSLIDLLLQGVSQKILETVGGNSPSLYFLYSLPAMGD
ncbi:MAG: signal peptide peptidase SppA, partial [Deltaproteobacteria bacterium]|nr:signal peptide peptidase SppA [Deltaproteobacteria bacterium]